MKWRGLVSGALSTLVLVGIAIFALPRAGAQSDTGALNLTTSPLPINLVTDPGETVTTDLRIRNSGTQTEQLQVGLLKFGPNDTSGQPRLADREPGDDYFDWVTFSEDTFTAEPNVWNTIQMTIQVPPEAALGYYYAVTFQRATGASADEGAALQGGTAVLVLLEARSPNARRQADITEFISTRKVYEFLPAEFNVTVKNSGNIHLIPTGNIYITRGDKQEAILGVNEVRGNILPDSSRTFTAAWNDGFPNYQDVEQDGEMLKNEDGTPKRTLKWDLSQTGKLRFGKYTATVLMVYDDGQRDVPIEAVLTFWVIPWRILGVLLLILGVIGVGIYVIIKRILRIGNKVPVKRKKADKSESHES